MTWGLVIGLAAARFAAVFLINVNWDEFALLERAAATLRTGEVVGGGRPGLATLALVPFVAACTNAVDALLEARVLWTLSLFGSLVGFWVLLGQFLPRDRYRNVARLTGIALWLLHPEVLRFSVQVRSDQPAILFGLWAGVALLASSRRAIWALLAGLLFGVGFLFSQKLIYVGGIVATLAAFQALGGNPRRWAHMGVRAALTLAAMCAVVLLYRWKVPSAPVLEVASSLDVFDYYRQFTGWMFYERARLLTIPQVLAGLFCLALSLDWARHRWTGGIQIAAGLTILAMGVFVLFFHAARFPYFFMVLMLFPAAVGALSIGPLLYRLEGSRVRPLAVASAWIPLVFFALIQGMVLSIDTLTVQRESLRFVERNFPADALGFEGHSAFTCREDLEPFGTRFYLHLRREFTGPEAAENTDAFLGEFRRRPVVFMIEPPARQPYPTKVRFFWRSHYVLYAHKIMVPGRRLSGALGWPQPFESVATSDYRWWAEGPSDSLLVRGTRLGPGGTIRLAAGERVILQPLRGGRGTFAYALADPPRPDTVPFFEPF